MVLPETLLYLDLFMILIGTLGTALILFETAEVYGQATLDPTYLLVSTICAVVAWALAIIIGPMGAPALRQGLQYRLRVLAGLAVVSGILFLVAAGFATAMLAHRSTSYLIASLPLLYLAGIFAVAFGITAFMSLEWPAADAPRLASAAPGVPRAPIRSPYRPPPAIRSLFDRPSGLAYDLPPIDVLSPAYRYPMGSM